MHVLDFVKFLSVVLLVKANKHIYLVAETTRR